MEARWLTWVYSDTRQAQGTRLFNLFLVSMPQKQLGCGQASWWMLCIWNQCHSPWAFFFPAFYQRRGPSASLIPAAAFSPLGQGRSTLSPIPSGVQKDGVFKLGRIFIQVCLVRVLCPFPCNVWTSGFGCDIQSLNGDGCAPKEAEQDTRHRSKPIPDSPTHRVHQFTPFPVPQSTGNLTFNFHDTNGYIRQALKFLQTLEVSFNLYVIKPCYTYVYVHIWVLL